MPPLRLAKHEQSETEQQQGQWWNLYGKNTPKAGQRLPGERPYPTVEEAVQAAKKRSDAQGFHSEPYGKPWIDPDTGQPFNTPPLSSPAGDTGLRAYRPSDTFHRVIDSATGNIVDKLAKLLMSRPGQQQPEPMYGPWSVGGLAFPPQSEPQTEAPPVPMPRFKHGVVLPRQTPQYHMPLVEMFGRDFKMGQAPRQRPTPLPELYM